MPRPVPEPLLLDLGLEAVDIADVVAPRDGVRLAVAYDDADVGGDRSRSTELVVDVGPDRQRLAREGGRSEGDEEQRCEQESEATGHRVSLEEGAVAVSDFRRDCGRGDVRMDP